MQIIKQVFNLKLIFLISASLCFIPDCQKIRAHDLDGPHGPTYNITPPLAGEDIKSCIYFQISYRIS